jgi:choline dehydrogenase
LRALSLHPEVAAISTRAEYGSSGRSMTDELTGSALDDWMFAECSDAQHATGTCRMGAADDPRAVVDPQCRVIGVTGLRVIDASVMPTITSGNTNSPTVMIAEKGSAMVLQDAR